MSVNALSLISLGESDKTLWSDKSINRSFFELSGKGAHKKADSYEISPQSKFWLGVQVLSSPTLSLSTLTYYTPVILNYLQFSRFFFPLSLCTCYSLYLECFIPPISFNLANSCLSFRSQLTSSGMPSLTICPDPPGLNQVLFLYVLTTP